MCYEKQSNAMPMGIEAQVPGAGCDLKQAAEPTLRDRLEEKRARLMTQLYQLEDALRLLSTDPNAEKNYEILRRARP